MFLKNFFESRRRKRADIHFRSGFLYAIDMRLFAGQEPLLKPHDVDRAPEAFHRGTLAGMSYALCVQSLDLEHERRLACCQ